MRERRVTIDEVIEALENPEQLVYDKQRDVYIAMGWNGVAVVYAPRGIRYEVVTVMRRREYEALLKRLGNRRYKIIA
ncbi:hypothetical protein Pyrfu_0942 [Pyrolobus fumarii 1A]|uniref:Uncharacterized protein n=1 Tax=Pyrolobus fumarii (strain DSM 11204 / 1A) TaxID=694429 RepID=G0EEB7_PYRF1|nr:hypothetical protein [Pyrolobus fumarii]AEM38811.1 hypothetical protein Pyrfu_0942 [Pyrolobus fumarii 1A]